MFLSLITINWNEIFAPVATSVLLSNIRAGTISWLSGQVSKLHPKSKALDLLPPPGLRWLEGKIVILFVFLFSLKDLKQCGDYVTAFENGVFTAAT